MTFYVILYEKIKTIGYNSDSKVSTGIAIGKNYLTLNTAEKAISQLFHGDIADSSRTVTVQAVNDKRVTLLDKLENQLNRGSMTEKEINQILEEYDSNVEEIKEITGIDMSQFIESE